MKKRLALLAVIIFTVVSLILAGCGSKSEVGKSVQPGNKQTSTENKEQSKKELSLSELLAKGQKVEGLYYEYVVNVAGQSVNGKVWMEGKKMKSEGEFSGQKATVIVNGETNVAYTILPGQNQALKVSVGDVNNSAETPLDYLKDINKDAKVLEATTLDGVKCRVVSMQTSDPKVGKTELKIWVREDYGIPQRVEASMPDGSKMTVDYKHLKIGKLPADTFELPAGMKVNDASNMMKQLPGVPKQ